MRAGKRGATLLCRAQGLTAAALVAACWTALPADADTRSGDGLQASGDGLHAALAAVAKQLAAAALAASPTDSASAPSAAVLGVAADSASRVPRPYRLAVVRGLVGLSERPGGPATFRLGSTTEFGSRRVLGVAARRGDWLGVVTSERPNNRLAWVRRRNRGLSIRRTRWSLHADLSARTLTLRRGRRLVHRMPVAVGRPGAETPTGRFAVTDKLSGSRYGPYYGCCILALNGHQPNPPPGWTGGNRLAIHGTDSPGTIGAAASAGCLRGADTDLRALMRRVPLGTPAFIRR